MNQKNVFRVFPNDPYPPSVVRADGMYIYTSDGREILDFSSGGTSFSILGSSHPDVNKAIIDQVSKFTHIDYKIWVDPNTQSLAEMLLSKAEHGLDRVYFSGNSGAEACEAAMKMSYQTHYDAGNKNKKWFISRKQSYHGSTSDALALGERPNLEFFRPMLSPYRAHISMHHPLYLRRPDESMDDYSKRCAKELEDKILEIGADNVSGFIGETIMGGLVGDVPPAINYWKYIQDVCKKYDVHLILDEVYCGTGTTGKIYCCDWDGVKPDFIFLGKTLSAGYGVLSAVVTSERVEGIIKKGQGRLQHTTTHQAHSLSVAAALAVQKIIHQDSFIDRVNLLGKKIVETINYELASCESFVEIRGRGLRLSVEYEDSNKNEFGHQLANRLMDKYNILLNAKWHRASITPALIVTDDQLDYFLDCFISEFINLSKERR